MGEGDGRMGGWMDGWRFVVVVRILINCSY